MPLNKSTYFFSFLISALLLSPLLHAIEDGGLSTAGAGFAPIDASKAQDPMVPVSKAQRDELVQQFKGLVAMGMTAQPYTSWNGKNMADCEAPKQSGENWCHKCEIDMPDAVGEYYFYASAKGGVCTLQQLDVHLHSTEDIVIKELRTPLQELLGRGSPVQTAGRHWDTGHDIADLFLDKSEESGSFIHFVWGRSPLILNHPTALVHRTAYVRAPSTPN